MLKIIVATACDQEIRYSAVEYDICMGSVRDIVNARSGDLGGSRGVPVETSSSHKTQIGPCRSKYMNGTKFFKYYIFHWPGSG